MEENNVAKNSFGTNLQERGALLSELKLQLLGK